MFRLLLMFGGSTLVLGFATASYALTAPPHTLNGFATVAIPVADVEEEAVEQALEPEEVTTPSGENVSESKGSGPSEENEIDKEEGKD